jgi:hypothetical protein
MYKEKINNKDDKEDDKVIDIPEEEVINRATAIWTLSI